MWGQMLPEPCVEQSPVPRCLLSSATPGTSGTLGDTPLASRSMASWAVLLAQQQNRGGLRLGQLPP